MKIGIDFRHVQLGKSGGVALLWKGLLTELLRAPVDHEYTLFCTDLNYSLFADFKDVANVVTLSAAEYYAELDKLLSGLRIDILVRSFPDNDDLTFPSSKQLVLVPDLQHDIFPDFFTLEMLRLRRISFNKALATAGGILTISEHAKKTIIDHAWTECKDITIVNPALLLEHQNYVEADLSDQDRELLPKNDFFLFSANLWPHKNHRKVLEAFKLFIENTSQPVELVLTGHPAGWDELRKEFADLPVKHLGFVSPTLLAALMKRAIALTFFSLFEGFGIPLLEAFHSGTPVICSNTSSLPEVGGDAVLSCDPTNVLAMRDLMRIVSSDESVRSRLIENGKKRLQLYSWKNAAANFLSACEKLQASVQKEIAITQNWQPLVTVVTPSYNQGRFIKRTIESVLQQTYSNIQYMVIDGGSSDETKEILESYQNKFYWVSERDNGQTHAINKGLHLAKGEILAYLNSDDVLMPDAIEKVVAYFAKNLECDLVYGDADYTDEDDKVIGKYNTDKYSFERLMRDCMICQPATFWRKRIADIAGPFDEEIDFAMDHDYWLRVDRAGGIIHFYPEILASSRLHEATKTLTARSKIYQDIFNVCKKHGGYVDYSYYLGLWKHNFYENPKLKYLYLLRIFVPFQVVARCHYLLTNGMRDTDRSFKKTLRRFVMYPIFRYKLLFGMYKLIAVVKKIK